jgi:hypothetical protein
MVELVAAEIQVTLLEVAEVLVQLVQMQAEVLLVQEVLEQLHL